VIRFLSALLISLVLLVSGCAAPARTAVAPAAPRAFAWEVEAPSGARLTLVGSIHMGKSGGLPIPPAVDAAFARADALVVEVDVGAVDAGQMQQAIMRLGMLPPERSLRQELGPELWARLEPRLSAVGLPPAGADRLRPWVVSVMLPALELAKAGYVPEGGVDKHFLDRARGKKAIVELESAEGQLRMLAGFDEALQKSMLQEQLEEQRRTDELVDAFAQAWRAGDADAMVQHLFADADRPEYKDLYERVFFARNRQMFERLRALLAQPGRTHFVVVGAGHVVGKDGLVDLFTRAGYRVRQLPQDGQG
jgi:hypothetical protein